MCNLAHVAIPVTPSASPNPQPPALAAPTPTLPLHTDSPNTHTQFSVLLWYQYPLLQYASHACVHAMAVCLGTPVSMPPLASNTPMSQWGTRSLPPHHQTTHARTACSRPPMRSKQRRVGPRCPDWQGPLQLGGQRVLGHSLALFHWQQLAGVITVTVPLCCSHQQHASECYIYQDSQTPYPQLLRGTLHNIQYYHGPRHWPA
jgi:hypothetical protein